MQVYLEVATNELVVIKDDGQEIRYTKGSLRRAKSVDGLSVYFSGKDNYFPTPVNGQLATDIEDITKTPYTDTDALFLATNDFFLDASDNGGGSLPNLDDAQRDALTNVPLGFQIYNTDSDEVQYRVVGGWYCTKVMHIGTGSVDTIVVSSDTNAPSFVTGFVLSENVGVELVDAITGTFENQSGRLIRAMTGTISFRPEETGGGVGELQICSERSTDGGTTYTITPISLRTIDVPSNGESFSTKVSFLSNFLPNERFRFLLVETGTGGVTLSPTTETIKGQVITSPSVTFEITEQGTIIEDAP